MQKQEHKKPSLGTVKLSKIKKAIQSIESGMPVADPDISFEFLIGSFYPKILDNIKKEMANQYIEGFNQGRKSIEDENKGNN